MYRTRIHPGNLLLALVLMTVLGAPVRAEDEKWVNLITEEKLTAWKEPSGAWQVVGDASQSSDDPKRIASTPGQGVIVNGPTGRTTNLVSAANFGDIEAHFEFLIPKGSNSGVKFEGLYEIQLYDSWGKKKPTASDCGGIYPRAELLPKYRYLDEGYPPRTNACLAPGTWQTLDVVFKAPKFDAQGKKVANARFVKVVLNGQIVHEDLEVNTPTGHAWRTKEVAEGPLLLQADHGPVAFRNIRVRPLKM